MADIDEIVSAEELAEAVVDSQHTEFKDQVDASYSAEINEENEHLEEERIAVEVEFKPVKI